MSMLLTQLLLTSIFQIRAIRNIFFHHHLLKHQLEQRLRLTPTNRQTELKSWLTALDAKHPTHDADPVVAVNMPNLSRISGAAIVARFSPSS